MAGDGVPILRGARDLCFGQDTAALAGSVERKGELLECLGYLDKRGMPRHVGCAIRNFLPIASVGAVQLNVEGFSTTIASD